MSELLTRQLINAMSNDLRAYRELKKVLEERFAAIKGRDAGMLQQTSDAQDIIMQNIAANTRRRMQIVDSLTKMYFPERLGRVRVTITDIAPFAPEPERGKMLALKAMLHKEVEQTQSLTRITNLAVKKMMGHLDFIFKAIVNLEHDSKIYNKTGMEAPSFASGLIDAIA
ncbi:MAG: flagellar export chaperone FlgN [Sedimentisphaerales bacterium]|nr:flagellar export chaperone FlgN [Sedimentisphaerales bacterium]MBN2843050.1 flagellar export chaperone FlgN [Sedimentisphaerales bacterium]